MKHETPGLHFIALLLILSLGTDTIFAQDQFINCRKFAAGIVIIIDGDPSDWPLSSFSNPAELPDIDPAENFSSNATTNAINKVPMKTGDHFVFDPNKVLVSTAGNFNLDETDFQATTYIGWNDTGFYLLNIVTDDLIGWFQSSYIERDINNQPAFTNDGIEMWFDNDNNRLPPNINDVQTSEFDLQTAFSIDAEIIREEFQQEPIMTNGLPLEFAIFRSALNTDNEKEAEIISKIQRAVKLDNKPMEQHTSYVQEIMFPWGVFPSFEPDEPIGFNINWIDWDDATFHLQRWHQANESDTQYFREMRFTNNNPLGGVAISDWSVF
ncbi:MAG: hypothetical protein C4527_18505 [Candidatus Omnitrophota bacterium]|jgi:hypothetical protein|nr:MAG: hypothetical protein C4527_18505 [Candidatus Omnitrophota bacterium]